MKMKILLLMFVLLLFLCAGQLQAQSPLTYPLPSWVTTAAPEPGMLPPGSTFTMIVYDASAGMQPVNTTFEIEGYWTGSLSNHVLYYAQPINNPTQFFLFNRTDVPNG